MNTYKISMYVKGTEDDAISLRKYLAQATRDEFELNAVFGVAVDMDNPPENLCDRVMALCMVCIDDGLEPKQIGRLMAALPEGQKYMQIEFHHERTSAYGFIEAEYYEVHDYKPEYFAEIINAIIEDDRLESPKCEYLTPDGRVFYMGYFNES